MSSSPLIFDGLLWVPTTLPALDAIAACTATLSEERAARSLYLAVLEFAFRRGGAGAAMSRRELGERAAMSMSLVSQLRPVLVKAGVVETRPRRDGNAQREHDWMIVDPRRDPSRPPSRSAPTPLAIRDTSRGRPSAVNGEGTKEDDGRAARAQPQLDEVLDILRPAFGAEILEHLVAPLNCVLAAHPEASGHDHRQAAHRTAAQAHLGNVRSPVGYFSKVLDEQTARGAGGPHGRPGRDSRLSAEVQARIERENDGFNRLMTQMGGWPTR